MAKFPEPPPVRDLRTIVPETITLVPGTILTRIYFSGAPWPIAWNGFRWFGPTSSRRDHHLPDERGQPVAQPRGVMYAALGPDALPTCLAEVFQSDRVVDTSTRRPFLVGFALTRPVELLDLSGTFVTALGASTAIHSGPRSRARRWAQRLHEAYPSIQGILYCSSMYGNAPAIALFERAGSALPEQPVLHRSLGDPLLAQALLMTAAAIRYEIRDEHASR